jgi:PknH-like extracellular domain
VPPIAGRRTALLETWTEEGGMRRMLAVLMLCALTAGCTATTGGTVVAAPTLGHAPEPLPASALGGLLLDAGEIGSIMGTGLEVVDSSDAMYTNLPLADGCLIWAEAQEDAYQGSGWSAVRLQQLRDRRDNADHIAYQAVVAFPDAVGAHDFYGGQVTGWAKCDNRRVDLHDPGDPDAHYWSLSKASNDDGVLTIVRVEEGGSGWACQRALTAKNNIVVDVSACAYNVDDRGAQIAKRIAKKIP